MYTTYSFQKITSIKIRAAGPGRGRAVGAGPEQGGRGRRCLAGPGAGRGGAGLTLDQPPLVLDDLLAEHPVLVAALDHEVLLAQQVLAAQTVGLQLRVLHLQLVRPAQ